MPVAEGAGRRWSLVLAGVICAAVYIPRLGAPLVWDDRPLIVQNPAFERAVPLTAFFTRRFFEVSPEQSWRPVSTLSRYLLARAFGKRPAPLRALNLILHAAAAWLLIVLLTGLGMPRDRACLASALFLVHPAHVETMMCATFSFEPFAAIGLLGMLIAHHRGKTAWAAAAFAFALLSKENAVLGLPIAVGMDAALRSHRSRRATRSENGLLVACAVYAGVLAAWAALQFGLLAGPRGAGGVSAFMPWHERLGFALTGLALAARVFLAPVRLRLDYFALPPATSLEAVLGPAVGAAALGAALWGTRRLWDRQRLAAVLLLWPLPFLALTSNLIPFDILSLRLLAERWLYIPLLGFAGFLAWVLAAPRDDKSRRTAAKVNDLAAAALMLFWGACGLARARDWSREVRLWQGMAGLYPWSSSVHEGLGESLFREGRHAEALEEFREALRLREGGGDRLLAHFLPLRPDGALRRESPGLRRWLGRSCAALGDLECAERHMARAAELDPKDGYTYILMTYAHAQAGDFRRARAWLRRGLKAKPQEDLLLRLKPGIESGRLTFRIRFF